MHVRLQCKKCFQGLQNSVKTSEVPHYTQLSLNESFSSNLSVVYGIGGRCMFMKNEVGVNIFPLHSFTFVWQIPIWCGVDVFLLVPTWASIEVPTY